MKKVKECGRIKKGEGLFRTMESSKKFGKLFVPVERLPEDFEPAFWCNKRHRVVTWDSRLRAKSTIREWNRDRNGSSAIKKGGTSYAHVVREMIERSERERISMHSGKVEGIVGFVRSCGGLLSFK